MKRLSTFLILACSLTLTALAHEISAEQSLRKAVATISDKSYAAQVRGKADYTLMHTQTDTQNRKALYYVFGNEANGGFVITGADHRANSVLGYTENGTFEQALAIPAFRYWLSNCEAAMQWLSNQEDAAAEADLLALDVPDRVVTNADNSISVTIPGRHYTEDPTLPASIEPLLGGIAWNQKDPFNRLCPEVEVNGQTIKCPTGCVATATAQVMKYWEWPKQGTGSYRYTSSKNGIEIELEADFSQSVYDWDNMLDDYTGDYTDEQAYAVAKLMSDVGIAVEMDYGAQSSSATSHSTIYAMATYFGYNKGMLRCQREYYTHAEWNDLMKTELAQSRPLIFGGDNPNEKAGHEFVIDGYNEDGNFHVNWGWGGISNGYFDISFIDPEDQGIGGINGGFPTNQEFDINCYPDTAGTSVARYQIVQRLEPSFNDGWPLGCIIANQGLATYVGQAGYVAMIDDEVVGLAVKDVEELPFGKMEPVMMPFEDLGVTPEMIGDKKCFIYPVISEGEGYVVPLPQAEIQSYIVLSLDEDGNLVRESIPEENPSPICESIEITRDYAGFSIKGKAVITNEEGHTAFDRGLVMIVVDEDKNIMAMNSIFAYVEAGESREIELFCNPMPGKELEIGKTYNVSLSYPLGAETITVPGSETTVTIQDPGAEPSLAYTGFALDKAAIAPGEEITVSFDVENTGGFGIETFYVALYVEGVTPSLNAFKVEADLPAGTTTVTKSVRINQDEGAYHIDVFTLTTEGEKNKLTPQPLYFTIKNSTTAISNVTDHNDLPARCYDLQGRCVATPTRGLYIKNGKTYILP